MLVPLCGKSADLLWLAQQGLEVTGVELSTIAARSFFEESGLKFETSEIDGFTWFRNREAGISIACGDYFEFTDTPFDALFDRAALSAVSAKKRPEYVRHTKSLLNPGAFQLVITLEFDDALTEGPPYPVLSDEVLAYWPHLQRAVERDDIANAPQKYLDVGLDEMIEVAWARPLA